MNPFLKYGERKSNHLWRAGSSHSLTAIIIEPLITRNGKKHERRSMTVKKGFAEIVAKYPNMKLVNPVASTDKGCTECKHTLFIPCYDHPYCINPKSGSYGFHYHSWDAACKDFEAGERYQMFDCTFYNKDEDCKSVVCPYEKFD